MSSSSQSNDQNSVFLCGYDESLCTHSKNTLLAPNETNSNIAKQDDTNHQTSYSEQYLHFNTNSQLREFLCEPIYYGSSLDQLYKKIRAEQSKLISEHFGDGLTEPDEKLIRKSSTISLRNSQKLNKRTVVKLFKRTEPAFVANFDHLTMDTIAANQLKKITNLVDAIAFVKKYGQVYPICMYNKVWYSYIGIEIIGSKEPNELFSIGLKYLKDSNYDQFQHDSVTYHQSLSSDPSKFSFKIKTFKAELAASYEPINQAQMVPLTHIIFNRVSNFIGYSDTQKDLVQKANELEMLNSRYLSSTIEPRLENFDLHSWSRAREFWAYYVYEPLINKLKEFELNLNLQQFRNLIENQLASYKDMYQSILLNSSNLGFFYLTKNYNLNSVILELKNKSKKIVLVFFDRNLIDTRTLVWTNILQCLTNYVYRIKLASVVLVDYELHPYLAQKMLAYKKCFYIEYLFRLVGLVRLGLNYSNQGRIVFNDIKLTHSSSELNLSRNNLIVLNKYQFNEYFYACFVKELNLRNCSLFDLEPGCFENMNVLQVLDLSGNYIKVLGPHFSRGLNELKVLNLSKCDISELDDRAFESLNNLQSLDLSYNQLKSIREKHLESLMMLESLDLGHNKIEQFENNMTFLTLSFLKKLFLNSNMFSSIDPLLFVSLINLEVLSLAGNKIQILKNIFQNLKNLKLLALNNCQIETISDDAFEDLESLQVIFLHINQVVFKSDIFKNLKNIQVLTLYTRDRDTVNQYKNLLERANFVNLKYFVHRYNEKKISNLINKYNRHPFSYVINELYLKSYL